MEDMRQYLIGILCAAMVSAIALKLLDGKGAAGQVGKLLCGIFVLLSIVQPLSEGWFKSGELDISGIYMEAESVVSGGEIYAKESLHSLIKQQLEAYILDKASEYEANVAVSVTLSADDIPVPVEVSICGNISPYGKLQLQNILQQELGIRKEDQEWICQ